LKVASVNIGKRITKEWHGKSFTTGIFKKPVQTSIELGLEDVVNDSVCDRKFHGGVDKACYLYPLDHYEYWKSVYPNLEWQNGMFGENLTIDGFDEQEHSIGDVFELGTSIVQISEPRQPCSTLNMRFDSNQMVKEFVKYGFCGAYLRVIKPGEVKAGDQLIKIEKSKQEVTLHEIFQLLYKKNGSAERALEVLGHPHLGDACKRELRKVWSI
jgi:MOSC domain-containing protein YiiM